MPEPESESKIITCIVCSSGCQIEVTRIGTQLQIVGNECKRGEAYAIEEIKAPKRILTTTLQVKNGLLPLIPVRSDIPVPKDKLFDCMKFLSKIIVTAPLKMGQILVKNILDLPANIIASRDLEEK